MDITVTWFIVFAVAWWILVLLCVYSDDKYDRP